MSFLYAAVLIGVLIFVHELGHFLVAKLFDVKVLRFSIGFGPKLIGYQRGETEYVICALPLGGYVQMLGMSFETIEDLPEEDRGRALMTKPIWQRSLVVLAGPVFNLVLPLFLYFIIVMFTWSDAPPALVGEVFDTMPAAEAGLIPGDKIVAIDDEPVQYWHEVTRAISPRPGEKIKVTISRDGETQDVTLVPERKKSTDFFGLNEREYGMVGIHNGSYGPTIAIPKTDSPAHQSGLRNFDRVISIDGQEVSRFDQIDDHIQASDGKKMTWMVYRRAPLDVAYGRFFQQTVQELEVTPVKSDDRYDIGIGSAEMVVSEVESGSPVEKAGLQIGDLITHIDGKKFSNWRMANRTIDNALSEDVVTRSEDGDDDVSKVKQKFEITFLRDGSEQSATLEPIVKPLPNGEYYQIEIGWRHVRDVVRPEPIAFPLGDRFVFASKFAVNQTYEFCRMTALGVVRLVQGRMSLSNVSGPIQIGSLAAEAGRAGWDKFFEMMAIISINLGIINLAPIPILDGGNLVLFAMEAIKRGPLSFRTRQIAAYIGFSLIIMLFVLAFKNDIERQWDNFADYVNEL